MNRENFLSEVIGLDEIKDELFNVVKWFKESEKYEQRGLSVPKGVILYGHPGNGKTMILRNIAHYLDIPTYIFPNNTKNIVETIDSLFKEASKNKKSIIIIDEIDLLFNADDESYVQRSLQEHLDGIEKNENDILILAACNHIRDIPQPIRRQGRFSRSIEVHCPKLVDINKILIKLFNDFNIENKDVIYDNSLAKLLSWKNFTEIKSIINDTLIRFSNKKELTLDDFLTSYNIIFSGYYEHKINPPYEICIHEAGHALVANKYKEFIEHNYIIIKEDSGLYESSNPKMSYKNKLARIHIALAGTIAEKIIFNKNTYGGNEEDLDTARNYAYNLVNCCGYKSCWRTLTSLNSDGRKPTSFKVRKNEIIIEKILRKAEKETYRYIKKHKNKLIELANKLQEKNMLSSKDINQILNNN